MTRLLIGDDRLELNTEGFTNLYCYYRMTVHVITTLHTDCSRRYGWLERQVTIFCNNNCFKRDKKHLMLKHKALEVQSSIVQRQ